MFPEDNERLRDIHVEFLRLSDDSAASAPRRLDELLRYLKLEVPGGDRLTAGDLEFRRTAELRDCQYWIWSFVEPDTGEPAYATIRADRNAITMGYDTDYYRLSPEQFILGEYCGSW